MTISWADHAIENQWLRVTVKATPRTGLAEPDVFYFGNAVGESGNQPGNAIVNATDEIFAPTTLAASRTRLRWTTLATSTATVSSTAPTRSSRAAIRRTR